jgi:hypothetical protein
MRAPRPIVVTIGAKVWTDLPSITAGDSVGAGSPVVLPEGLRGKVLSLGPAIKAAGSPDDWRAVIQFAVDAAGPMTRDLFVGALGAWLYDIAKDRLPGKKGKPHPDQGALRVFVGHLEIEVSDREVVAAAIQGQLDAGSPSSLPPQLRPTIDEPSGLTSEEWVQRQIELSRAYHERVARLLAPGQADDKPRTHHRKRKP